MKTDKDIQKDVTDELDWTPILKGSKICVDVEDGALSLDGFVTSYSQKVAAKKTALRVKGVKSFKENLKVYLADNIWLPDTRLVDNIRMVLDLTVSVPQGIGIKADDGVVTLTGDVEFDYQREAAENAIENLKGVRGIINRIAVKASINTSLIQENIRRALERRIDQEAKNITITTSGNKVILRGIVHSWNERKEAAHAAWSAPGVAVVEDLIVIDYD